MRKILFRGKRIDNGEWVYGVAFPHDNCGKVTMFRQNQGDGALEGLEVLHETVGQYTGLTDKNGKKIFDGDIVKVTGLYPDRDGEQRIWRQFRVGEVFYYHGAFFFGKWELQKASEKCIEIIGNIHDNPELLEVTE